MDEESEFAQFASGAASEVAANVAGQVAARRAVVEQQKKLRAPIEQAQAAGKKLMEAMKRQKANWQMDGKGIRGDVVKVSNSRANLIWDSTVATRRADSNIDGGETIAHADADPAAADPGG